ncbi:hypothetical protein LTR33_010397 [Friedmanniomyces endolithicus]|nr:hypothetical protein LTR33_010397 [Friedmanniomyces endolithicus]
MTSEATCLTSTPAESNMRFLNTTTYHLEDFGQEPWPPYAILSHTWLPLGSTRVVRGITSQDLQSNASLIEDANYKPQGWAKLKAFCDLARSDGWQYGWMDMCCIDKTNPSDTQEAINAMFRWYSLAGVGYAHLAGIARPAGQRLAGHYGEDFRRAFRRAYWFQGAWTLQELLAPPSLIFVDQSWDVIGTKAELAQDVADASDMDPDDLTEYPECSVGKKLSWAARRSCTMEEDHAYSLLGLFGVSMPLCYGEGGLAFRRFQAELIKVHPDPSIFSFLQPEFVPSKPHRTITADIEDFATCGTLTCGKTSFSLSNIGLTIGGWLSECTQTVPPIYMLWLDCWDGPREGSGRDTPSPNCIGIPLRRSSSSGERYVKEGYAKRYCDVDEKKFLKAEEKTILIEEPAPETFITARERFSLKFDRREVTCSHMVALTGSGAPGTNPTRRPVDDTGWEMVHDEAVDRQQSWHPRAVEYDETLYQMVYYRYRGTHAVLQLVLSGGKVFRLLLESGRRRDPICHPCPQSAEMDRFIGGGTDKDVENIQARIYPLPPIQSILGPVPVYLVQICRVDPVMDQAAVQAY